MILDSFYGEIIAHEIVFSQSESLHLTKVLRKKVGDRVGVFDGKGNYGIAELTKVHAKETLGVLHEKHQIEPRKNPLTLAIAPTKSIDRFEFALEKATEMGVSRIVPLQCFHSERKKINIERCERIVLAAAKQSRKVFLPTVEPLTPLQDFLANTSLDKNFIAHCREEITRKSIQEIPKESPTTILIGPEGDFSKQEIILAESLGYQSIYLSKQRLRTETAAVFVAMVWDYSV